MMRSSRGSMASVPPAVATKMPVALRSMAPTALAGVSAAYAPVVNTAPDSSSARKCRAMKTPVENSWNHRRARSLTPITYAGRTDTVIDIIQGY
jgi:hypothetical protein